MSKNNLSNIIQFKAYRIVGWQLAGVFFLSILVTFFAGINHGMAALAGGLAYGFPNLIFVWRVFRYSGAQQMNQFAAAFMLGEALKLILSGILFLIIVKTLPVSLLFVLIGFAGAIISFWVVCMWQFSRKTG